VRHETGMSAHDGRGGEDRPEALSCRVKRAPLGDHQAAPLTLGPYSPSLGETMHARGERTPLATTGWRTRPAGHHCHRRRDEETSLTPKRIASSVQVHMGAGNKLSRTRRLIAVKIRPSPRDVAMGGTISTTTAAVVRERAHGRPRRRIDRPRKHKSLMMSGRQGPPPLYR
jgi:hypothetical protein